MAEPTILEVFGANATQTATTITIIKADLSAVSLTASASNTAESLLAAIVLKAQAALTQAAFEANPDQSVVVEPGFDSIVQRDNGAGTFVNYRQNQLTVSLYKPDAGGIDPDDY